MTFNIFKTLTFALLAAALTGCSHGQEDAEETNGVLSRFNANGEAFLTLSINIPTPVTRAENGTFKDGDDNVADVYFFLFAGADESTAEFASAYKPTMPTPVSSDGQISKRLNVKISGVNIKDKDRLYAFVLLNNNAGAITTTFGSDAVTSVAFASGYTLSAGTTFAYFSEATITEVGGSGSFIMTNAVLSNAKGGVFDPSDAANAALHPAAAIITTLTDIPQAYFFPTEAEATAHPAGSVNVERLAAKVTTTYGVASGNEHVIGNANIDFAASDIVWALDNYNTASYIVKHFNPAWRPYRVDSRYRFVEEKPAASDQLYYRTYWAADINYDDGNTSQLTRSTTPTWQTLGTDFYCAENTFDVAHMTDENTTSVLVRLRLNGGTGFYTATATGSDVVYQHHNNPTLTEEGTAPSESFGKPRRSAVVANSVTIDAYLRQWLQANSPALREWLDTYAAGDARYLKIEINNETTASPNTYTTAGTVPTAQITLSQTARKSGTDGDNAFSTATDKYTETGGKTLKAYLTDMLDGILCYYPQGYCYYRLPIRHFGDELTPWEATAAMTDGTPAKVYDTGSTDYEARYLGRYGIVRNNWYELKIEKISHVGSATIPALTADADDTANLRVNATITINPWTTE